MGGGNRDAEESVEVSLGSRTDGVDVSIIFLERWARKRPVRTGRERPRRFRRDALWRKTRPPITVMSSLARSSNLLDNPLTRDVRDGQQEA